MNWKVWLGIFTSVWLAITVGGGGLLYAHDLFTERRMASEQQLIEAELKVEQQRTLKQQIVFACRRYVIDYLDYSGLSSSTIFGDPNFNVGLSTMADCNDAHWRKDRGLPIFPSINWTDVK